jgi:hypothetical protein
MRILILYLSLLLFTCCINKDQLTETDNLNEVISSVFNSKVFYYSINDNYPEILENEIYFLVNERVKEVNFDLLTFNGKPINSKTSKELYDTKNPNFFYFLDIKISQELAKIILVYRFSPVITIYLEMIDEEWQVLDCVTRYQVFLKTHDEGELVNEISEILYYESQIHK